VERNLDIGHLTEIYVEEVARYAAEDSLVADNHDRVLLALNPVDEGLQSPNRVEIGFARGVPEEELLGGPLLIDLGMLLRHLEVGEILANAGIDLIKDAQLYWGLFVDLDVPGSGDGAFEGAGEDGEVAPLLFTGY